MNMNGLHNSTSVSMAAEDHEAKRAMASEMLSVVATGLAAIEYVSAVDARFDLKGVGTQLNKSAYLQMKLMMEDFLSDGSKTDFTSHQMDELLSNYKSDVSTLVKIALGYRRNVWIAKHVFGVNAASNKSEVPTPGRGRARLNLVLVLIFVGLLGVNVLL